MKKVEEDKGLERYEIVRDIVRTKLIESGDFDRLRCFVRRRLSATTWKSDMMRELRAAVREKGACKITAVELFDRTSVFSKKIDERISEEAIKKIKHCYIEAMNEEDDNNSWNNGCHILETMKSLFKAMICSVKLVETIMSLVNIYLKETPLTSTKNKLLREDLQYEISYKSSLGKRKIGSSLMSPYMSFNEKFLKSLNVNDSCLIKKKTKAKKKKLQMKSRPKRCVVHGRGLTSDDFVDSPAGFFESEGYRDQNQSLSLSPHSRQSYDLAPSHGLEKEGLDMSIADLHFNILRCNKRALCATALSAMPAAPMAFGSCSPNTSQTFGSSQNTFAFGHVQGDCVKIPETVISKMPSYKLDIISLSNEMDFEYFQSYTNISSDVSALSFAEVKRKKEHLLNVISIALLFPSNLKNEKDSYRMILQKLINEIRVIDPEFILKMALYARQELHIRAVTNFLLAYSALYENTRIYLEKFFESCIVLPTDWIQVAEYFHVLNKEAEKNTFPAALRRAMKKCFAKFDQYQLAKHNKVRSKMKQCQEKKGSSEEDMEGKDVVDSSNENLEVTSDRRFTIKQLIRLLHIDSPPENVLCLLGKKYPKNQEEFKACGLSGVWDSSKAGIRMKLPIPETWETQVSAYGNKKNVWEALIDNKKLPYMAMLRNLRNLILAGISSEHHQKVISYLENKKAVINSRQLPMQFFEAFKTISGLYDMAEDDLELQFSRHTPLWKKIHLKKMRKRLKNVSYPIIEQYKSAISNALEISSLNNLYPIPGKTLVICQISSEELDSSSKMKNFEICIMMGLMCLKACEDCKMRILSYEDVPDEIGLKEDDQFLDKMLKTCEKYEKLLLKSRYCEDKDVFISGLKSVLDYYLKPHTALSLKLDHIVLLQTTSGLDSIMSSFLQKYRQLVNSDLLYTNVNFSLNSRRFSEESANDKDVYLCGSSSSLIKFISERSSGGQLACVENIDRKYNLQEISESKYSQRKANNISNLESIETNQKHLSVSLNHRMPKWHTIRIFISSTFKDMMSERDLLVRYVFPELRRRAASVFVRIVEIDLRWGITETDSTNKRAAELCLIEAQNTDLFVGLIGERYGTIYDFEPPDNTQLQWVKDYVPGMSITELEMYAAALRAPELSQEKAFFYFRHPSFENFVPKKWVNYFTSEDTESKLKVSALKDKIRSLNFKIFDGYPCHWSGIFENKPVLAGLDVLGNRVLDDLWKAVQKIHKTDPYSDCVEEEDMYQQNLIESKDFFIEQKDFTLADVNNKIKSEKGTFVIVGPAGAGKTTFLINLLHNLNSYKLVQFFIGVSPRSRDLSHILLYICKSICHQLGVSIPLPNLPVDIVNQFPDFLEEATNLCGGMEMVLLLDGLDYLESDDQRLDWLPLVLPNRFKLVCSTSESSLAFKVLCERKAHGSSIFFLEMPPLLQSEREKFVRNYLSSYRKSLDENAFSNNMLKIVTKKDSSNPFYLRVACDFLRIYATFDNLVSMLQKLPSSTTLLFQEIIIQMESEFGSNLVQSTLTLLCITKEGLEDVDLHYILSFITYMNDLKSLPPFDELKKKIKLLEPENFMNLVKYYSLIHVISTFVYGHLRQKCLSLIGSEFENSVKKYYLNKNFDSCSKSIHCILAGYYFNMCDVNNDGKYHGQSGFAFRSLLYHMFSGCLYKELSDLLCRHKFIEAIFRTNASDEFLEYYSSLLFTVLPTNQKLSREIDSFYLLSFYNFVSRNFHIFHQYPQLVVQQALNEPSDSLVTLKSSECNTYCLENVSRDNLVDCRTATLCGFVKNITASAGENMKPIVILGSEDGYLKVLDLSTRKVIRTIKSHTSIITCICFVGKNHLCVSSVDGTLSVWDCEDFSRIHVLTGHRHYVTSCCSDPAGSLLYSSGWDNSVRLWSLRDGRSISVIEDFGCPVNCVDHHPQKQQIACGLWNGNIEIWDTVSMQKKLVFSNINGSVKSLAYTPDGVNILASYIQSEISIWSSEEGLKISSLKGHILPVKAIAYSLDSNLFVSGSDDCTLKVWSSVQGSHFNTIQETKFCPISLMEFLSNNLLAVAFQNSEIWIIDIISGNTISKVTLKSDNVCVFSKYCSISLKNENSEDNWNEKLLVFGTQAGKLMIEDLLTSSLSTVLEMYSRITAVIMNNEVIVCGSAEGDIGICSCTDNKLSNVVSGAHRGFIGSFSLTVKSGKLQVLSAGNDNVLKLWTVDSDTLDLSIQHEFFNKHRDSISYTLLHLGSSEEQESTLPCRLFTGSHDNNVLLWKDEAVKIFKGLQSSVVNITCTDNYILGCGNDGSVVLWSENGSVLTSVSGIEMSSTILTFYVTEDDSDKFAVTLAFVDQDGSIQINKPLQQSFSCSFEGHSKPITSCCIAENGEIVSCSLDGSVNLWKVPSDIINSPHMHASVITGIILSSSLQYAVSADAHGGLILWTIQMESPTSPLVYAGKKSYDGCFIKALSWLKNDSFVCAVSQLTRNKELFFLNIIEIKKSSHDTSCLQVKKTHAFESEILCLDSCPINNVIVVGLKSGDVVCITPEAEKCLKMSNDWIFGVCFFSLDKTSDRFCLSYIDGTIKLFSVKNFINSKYDHLDPFTVYENEKVGITSNICCGEGGVVCCGDSYGNLRIYVKHTLKFTAKAHDNSISGLCIVGSHLFTSSFDKTLKVWSLKSYKQVCQFHSQAPLSSLSTLQKVEKSPESTSHALLVGTTSGNVHLLKFFCK